MDLEQATAEGAILFDIANPSDSVEVHPKFVEALSQSSNLYGILWPDIVKNGDWRVRLVLRDVNRFLRELCDALPEVIRKDDRYRKIHLVEQQKYKHYKPFELDLDGKWEFGPSWLATTIGATYGDMHVELEDMCYLLALGGIQLDSRGRTWVDKDGVSWLMWMSNDRDVMVETMSGFGNTCPHCGCWLSQWIGVTGERTKIEKMQRYVSENILSWDTQVAEC